jgi:hypothetical protein
LKHRGTEDTEVFQGCEAWEKAPWTSAIVAWDNFMVTRLQEFRGPHAEEERGGYIDISLDNHPCTMVFLFNSSSFLPLPMGSRPS